MAEDKITVESIHVPGRSEGVRCDKYEAMKAALLPVTPTTVPGITVSEPKTALLRTRPDELFPGGKTTGWWLKRVQRDLEAQASMRVRTKSLCGDTMWPQGHKSF